jgi:acyl-CoA hydrolase
VGIVVAYADGVDVPRLAPEDAARAADVGVGDEGVEALVGWLPDGPPWLAAATGRTTMAGYALRAPVAEGRFRYLPVRLSAVPRLLASTAPDVAVASAVRRGDELVFGPTVGIGPALARSGRSLLVEVDPQGVDLGGPALEGSVTAVVERDGSAAPVPAPRPPEEIDLAIGRRVAAFLPDRPTLQFGPGGVADAIAASVDRPVSIWSGVVTDAVAALAERGVLDGVATTAYTWGGTPVERLAADGRLRLEPVEVTHDPSTLAGIERFVACNTAVQVGLDGAVNVERVGGRPVAGIGGHADFAAGASRSPGGLSVVALRSTTRTGASTIVPSVEVVSTPRCDVEVVITEHGVADLRGVDDEERARRIVAIADPAHRDALAAAVEARNRPGDGPTLFSL